MTRKIFKFLRWKCFYYINRKRFNFLSSKAYIHTLLKLDGKENITIQDKVVIQKYTWLAAVPLTNAKSCSLTIGEGSIIGHFNHIFATSKVEIGKNVLTADKVYISDNQHRYSDITIPILSQGILQLPHVKIGDGSWICENVCVLGASIGRNCVIGANSVVTKDVPDFCIAVGAPARVIKRFNLKTNKWEKIQNVY